MENVITLLARTVSLYMFVMMSLIMLRFFISLMSVESPSKFELFVYSATEPLVFPVRCFLMNFETFQSIPIDFSLAFTLIILSILRLFL
jgi:uncharacterized protein YggT (Ycf19 family)